jgi:tRNA threonylcarbamoyladenosine biosynthesis protein TsaB
MHIFALDASQKTVAVSILTDDEIRADLLMTSGRHHSETLLPAIESVFRATGLRPDEMDCFAVTLGPGSFTGLRIGAATIKGLALATGKPVVGVSTLDALAQNAAYIGRRICPMLDAQKNQVYTALYSPAAGSTLKKITEERVVDVDLWLRELTGDIFFLGDGAVKYARQIQGRLHSANCFAEGCHNAVRATATAVLARKRFSAGERLDLLTFAPSYLRLSEAEIRDRQKTSRG